MHRVRVRVDTRRHGPLSRKKHDMMTCRFLTLTLFIFAFRLPTRLRSCPSTSPHPIRGYVTITFAACLCLCLYPFPTPPFLDSSFLYHNSTHSTSSSSIEPHVYKLPRKLLNTSFAYPLFSSSLFVCSLSFRRQTFER